MKTRGLALATTQTSGVVVSEETLKALASVLNLVASTIEQDGKDGVIKTWGLTAIEVLRNQAELLKRMGS